MIISASRRTDIPAFYARWLMNRIRAGYCIVSNPFKARQLFEVSLKPADVDAIVFWTRNAHPLLPHLAELDERGFNYYFQYTINGYGRSLEPCAPALNETVSAFRSLAERVGPARVIWRYDPIILGNRTPPDYHRQRFEELAGMLDGATERVMVSVATFYRKTRRRLTALERGGFSFEEAKGDEPHVRKLLAELAAIARGRGLDIYACATETDLRDVGILPGRCIDGDLLRTQFGLDGSYTKDPGQRKPCGCAVSRDIGVVDTCLHGCVYCYATRSDEVARRRHAAHNPEGESLWSLQEINRPSPWPGREN